MELQFEWWGQEAWVDIWRGTLCPCTKVIFCVSIGLVVTVPRDVLVTLKISQPEGVSFSGCVTDCEPILYKSYLFWS